MKILEGVNIKKGFKNKVAQKLFKNSSWLIGEKVFSMLIGVFIIALIARYLGPENYGQFNYALSFVALFTAFSTLGLETLTVKTLVEKKYDEGTILCTSFYLRLVGGGVLTLLASVIIRILEPVNENLYLLVLIMSFSMTLKSFEVIEYWIQANYKAHISSIIRALATLLSSSLKILFVLLEGSLYHLALISLIDVFFIGVALFLIYFKIRTSKSKWNFSINYAKYILSQSWYLILTGIMVTLYMKIDQVMLGSMLKDKSEVGIYSAAVQVAQMWFFVPMAIITSFRPLIMSRKIKDEKIYLDTVQLLYTIVAWIGIGFGVFILLFSDLIISVLYGSEYSSAAAILSISIWAGTFALLGSARGAWLVSEGLQKYSLIYIGTGAIVNICLNYLLIPILGGFGAAGATLVSQITVAIIVPLFFEKTRISSVMMLKAFILKGIIKKTNNI